MLRRRTPSPSPASTANAPAGEALLDRLRDADWVLPRSLAEGGPPRWSLTGTFGSPVATPVDTAGLVVADGWSLDWWVGADDRWHLPAREVAVRQQLRSDAPVVETLLRIPGGDAIQRTYGIRSPREEGDEWIVAEIENATAIPFAVALVVRPFMADGIGSINRITVRPVAGGAGRDEAHLVLVDDRPALVLPRRPARFAAGSLADGDATGTIIGGGASRDIVEAHCDEGLATLALLLPLTHSTVIRTVLPVGSCEPEPGYPQILPEVDSIVSGWDAHRREMRIDFPGSAVGPAFERARAHILLASDGASIRRDGQSARALDPGATETILGALDLLDRPTEVGPVVARWMEDLAEASPQVDALFLTAISRHWLLHRVNEILDWMLPEIAGAIERIDRGFRRGRLSDVDRSRAVQALTLAATLLRSTDQARAADDVTRLVERIRPETAPELGSAADALLAAGRLAASGDPVGYAEIRRLLGEATSASTWPGPGGDGRLIGHDLAASAAYVHAARSLIVGELADGLDLVPHLSDDWYGGPIEVHDAPTVWGRLSFGIRWHGVRPALLWDLSPHPGVESVLLRSSGLDPTWHTTELRGEAVLGKVRPPRGLRKLRIVTEHPPSEAATRRSGGEPAGPGGPNPDGGSSS